MEPDIHIVRYSEIGLTLFFCGGECAEDIQVHLRRTLEQIPDNKVASADTMLREVKSLAVDNTEVVSTSEKVYQFNINKKMNELNMKSLLLTGQLEKGGCYDFDYDNASTSSATIKSSVTRNSMPEKLIR